MIAFTGPCPGHQYVQRKLNPTGLKKFVLQRVSGLGLDFVLYQGTGSFDLYEINGKKAGQRSRAAS